MGVSLLPRGLPREVLFFLAHCQITRVNDLRNDINAVFELKRDEVCLAVLDLVECGLLASRAADVGEPVVVVDRGNQKRFARGLCVKKVVEPELRCVTRTELIDLFHGARFGGADLLAGLLMNVRQLLLVRLRVGGSDIATERAACGGSFLWFDK